MIHFKKSNLRVTLSALALVAASAASAVVTFDFNFTDAAGVGFNVGGSLGAMRQASLNAAGAYISAVLGSSYSATLNFNVNGGQSGPNTLASAGSFFNGSYQGPGFGYEGDVMTKILGGPDPSAGPDGQVNWNFASFDWGYSTVSNTQYDFYSTAVHELTHAIGFASTLDQNGNGAFNTAPGDPSEYSHFDSFLADSQGNLIDHSTDELAVNRYKAAEVSGTNPATNDFYFTGAHAVAANGGHLVQIYAPTTYEPGSTGSHLNDGTYDPRLYIMDAQTDTGYGPHVYSGLEIGMLQDLGYTNAHALTTVPGPASFVSFGVTALAMVRRRRKGAKAARKAPVSTGV